MTQTEYNNLPLNPIATLNPEILMQEDKRNATYLVEALKEYKDEHSKELRAALLSFLGNPRQDIRKLLEALKTPPEAAYCFLYSASINMSICEIEYPVFVDE